MENATELLVVTTGNSSQSVPWGSLQGAQLIRRRVKIGFGTLAADAKTEQIILAK